MTRVTDAIKKKSKLSKEEWREYTKTVWHIANTSHKEHPAVFPVDIPYRLIKLFSWHGEAVLDPFAGVGTTAKAAIPLGRKVVCVDQNKQYTNIIHRDCGHLNIAATLIMPVGPPRSETRTPSRKSQPPLHQTSYFSVSLMGVGETGKSPLQPPIETASGWPSGLRRPARLLLRGRPGTGRRCIRRRRRLPSSGDIPPTDWPIAP